jgi:hypothetical protein
MAKQRGPKTIEDKLKQRIQKIANDKNTTIISFIASNGVRTSPISFISASIGEKEIYEIEKNVKEAVKRKSKSLHFIIHTPGGEMHTSYKIANFLRSKFDNIKAFVPYEAASGGTILCCAANEVYISDIGNITAFDPQVRYKNSRVAAFAFERSVEHIQDEYGEMSPEEIPPPWQQMADKLDPVVYDEMHTALFTSQICAVRLLKKSGYDTNKVYNIPSRLARNIYTHEFPIFRDEAQEIGFNVLENDIGIMETYQDLVLDRLGTQHTSHIIDVFYPELEINTGVKKNEKPKSTKRTK